MFHHSNGHPKWLSCTLGRGGKGLGLGGGGGGGGVLYGNTYFLPVVVLFNGSY